MLTMRVLLPVTILALFGSTAVTACQANGSIGYNFDIQTLASIRCCSGCGYNSCTVGDACFILIHQNPSPSILTLFVAITENTLLLPVGFR
jgi:hypothetical protein